MPDERHEALKPYLEKLAAVGKSNADAEAPLRINVGGDSFHIDPWERDALLQSLEGPQQRGTQRWRTLLAQGVALQAKTLSDIHKLEQGGDAAGLGEALRLDATIAFALLEELQRAVDQAVVAGEMEHARRLTQFRNKLSRCLDAVESRLQPADFQTARELSEELVALPDHRKPRRARAAKQPEPAKTPAVEQDAARIEALVKLEQQLDEQLRRKQRAAAPEPALPRARPAPAPTPAPRGGMRRIVWLVLAGLVAVWLGMVVWPQYRQSRLPVFSTDDFRDTPAVTHVVARPPSLFLTVDEDAWTAMDPTERNDLMQALGRRLSVAGYSGAHVKSSAGRTVGQWLKQSGAKVIEPGRR